MAITLAAFSYIIALIIDAFLIIFTIFHVRAIFKPNHNDYFWNKIMNKNMYIIVPYKLLVTLAL